MLQYLNSGTSIVMQCRQRWSKAASWLAYEVFYHRNDHINRITKVWRS